MQPPSLTGGGGFLSAAYGPGEGHERQFPGILLKFARDPEIPLSDATAIFHPSCGLIPGSVP